MNDETLRPASLEYDDDLYERVIQARKQLVAEGLLIDSGRRRLNPRTGKMEVVWIPPKYHQ